MRARGIAVGAALALALVIPAAASATPPVTVYHGTFTTAGIFGCPTGIDDPATFDIPLGAGGTWNVTILGDLARVQTSVFGDFGGGLVHVDAFGGVKHGVWEVLPTSGNEAFHVRIPTDKVAGATDDFILTGSALEFRITPYPIFAPDGSLIWCDHASTFGVAR